MDTGLRCAFVNAHHHLHIHPFIRRTLVETIAGEFNGWIRWGRPEFFAPTPARFGYGLLDRLLHAPQRKRLPFPLTTTVWGIDRTFKMDAAEIQGILPALGEGLHEFIFHPRSIESDADTLPKIIREMLLTRVSERQGRLIDFDEEGSMETKKREGYF